ncbi:hypothetical protein P8F49_003952 [Salmonella enterica]|uniref:hypothetical protein n=1 Tax=Salmonella enterica TaxID=28901 RepID=UPI001131D4C0|nr:hypothetical protein [Salmonella enterica]EEJ6653246.1 hypothetical protein [Salmonella enterica subsp. enterica serovar Redlands]EAM8211258.1 hypothetical protein [Salmonella enterica]EAW9501369.1 hypothetical protein [Salmonella enterica]EBE1691443.1 hypothetical protein [Salmonella enterica]EDU0714741.1 hypothetical protein [Salmonella enterica]
MDIYVGLLAAGVLLALFSLIAGDWLESLFCLDALHPMGGRRYTAAETHCADHIRRVGPCAGLCADPVRGGILRLCAPDAAC